MEASSRKPAQINNFYTSELLQHRKWLASMFRAPSELEVMR